MQTEPLYRSERNFRRYEAVIARICSEFPARLTIKFPKGTPSTHAARLADAIRWFLRRGWTSMSVDPQRLGEIQSQLTVEPTDEGVVVRPRTYTKRRKGAEVKATPFEAVKVTPLKYAGELIGPSNEQITAGLNALELGIIQYPLKLSQVSPEGEQIIQDFLSTALNVVFRREGNHIILL